MINEIAIIQLVTIRPIKLYQVKDSYTDSIISVN